jgi:hypothetical protein
MVLLSSYFIPICTVCILHSAGAIKEPILAFRPSGGMTYQIYTGIGFGGTNSQDEVACKAGAAIIK